MKPSPRFVAACLLDAHNRGYGTMEVNERNREITSTALGWYYCRMFNFGKPKTAGDWIVHIAGAIVAIFLVWWMLRMYVL
jgi:hypothetical protein